jgi:hypothetical protein
MEVTVHIEDIVPAVCRVQGDVEAARWRPRSVVLRIPVAAAATSGGAIKELLAKEEGIPVEQQGAPSQRPRPLSLVSCSCTTCNVSGVLAVLLYEQGLELLDHEMVSKCVSAPRVCGPVVRSQW